MENKIKLGDKFYQYTITNGEFQCEEYIVKDIFTDTYGESLVLLYNQTNPYYHSSQTISFSEYYFKTSNEALENYLNCNLKIYNFGEVIEYMKQNKEKLSEFKSFFNSYIEEYIMTIDKDINKLKNEIELNEITREQYNNYLKIINK